MWEPIIGAASAAQPIPADVTTDEHHATRGTEPPGDFCKVPAAPCRLHGLGDHVSAIAWHPTAVTAGSDPTALALRPMR
jgi:hypothetical protein